MLGAGRKLLVCALLGSTACRPRGAPQPGAGLSLLLVFGAVGWAHPPPVLLPGPRKRSQAATGDTSHPFVLLQMWHWGEKRRLAQYYSELYAREKAEEDAYTDELRAKLRALEEELLA